MKLTIIGLLVCTVVCPAQSPKDLFEKAPPDVDAALRKRIGQFYQGHVDRRLRAADDVVAEDSKDMFFAIAKPHFLGWEIASITYLDNFTKAKAVVACDIDWANPRLGKIRVKQPLASLWKVVDGQWFWYMEPVKSWDTAFGEMRPGPDRKEPVFTPGAFKGVKVEDVLSQVKMEPAELQLRGYEPSSGEAVITNRMLGKITLRLDYAGFTGLDIKLDKTELASGESATISVRLTPADKAPKPAVTARVHVQPTNQVLPLKLTFAIPPEVQKQLPALPLK